MSNPSHIKTFYNIFINNQFPVPIGYHTEQTRHDPQYFYGEKEGSIVTADAHI